MEGKTDKRRKIRHWLNVHCIDGLAVEEAVKLLQEKAREYSAEGYEDLTVGLDYDEICRLYIRGDRLENDRELQERLRQEQSREKSERATYERLRAKYGG